MDKQRSVRWDVAAVVMFAVAALVWLSLLTHDPADNLGKMPAGIASLYQPLHTAFPLNSKIQNGAGYVGALVSDILLQATGVGAYLVAGLTVLSGVVMIRQQPWASSWGRSVGWSLILIAVCCIPSRFGLNPKIPVPIDGGGYLGALCKVWMDNHLAHAGAVILVLSMLIGGLLLSTEYALLRYFGYAATGSMLAINYFRVPSWSLRRHRELLSGTFSPKRADLPNSLTMRQDPTSISTTIEPFATPAQNQGLSFPSIRSAVQSVTRAISQTVSDHPQKTMPPRRAVSLWQSKGGRPFA
jgi:S-DNA-T family DNA segregation ATPase FtsK/SpoIIIE